MVRSRSSVQSRPSAQKFVINRNNSMVRSRPKVPTSVGARVRFPVSAPELQNISKFVIILKWHKVNSVKI